MMDGIYPYGEPGLQADPLFPDYSLMGFEQLNETDLAKLLHDSEAAFSTFSGLDNSITYITNEEGSHQSPGCNSDGGSSRAAESSHATPATSLADFETDKSHTQRPRLVSHRSTRTRKPAYSRKSPSRSTDQHGDSIRESDLRPGSREYIDDVYTSRGDATEEWRPDDLFEIGYVDKYGDWRCKFEGCKSERTYERACDLRKHYNGHVRRYFCEEDDCKWGTLGFASKKDLERHLATHNPRFRCPAIECDRTFSRGGMCISAMLVDLYIQPSFKALLTAS